MIRRAATVFAAGLLASGCVVGPAYRPPAAPPGAEGVLASVASERGELAPAAVPDAWWRLYDDKGVDAAVEEALRANSDLRAADANLRAARAVLSVTAAARTPATAAEASAVYGRPELANLLAADVGARAGADWTDTTGVSVAYQLDLFGQIRRAVEAARADAEAAEAARDAVRVVVAAETAAAYADACALGVSLDVAARSLDLARRIADGTARRAADGAETSLDVARARSLLEDTRAAIPPLEAQRRGALLVLAVVMGRLPNNAPAGAVACRGPLKLAAPLPIGDGGALLRRRPDLRVAERNLAAATAHIGVATAALYPVISLGGSIALTADAPQNLVQYASQSYGLGPSVSWSFPNQTAVRARIRQSQAQAEGALARLDAAVLQALGETSQSLSTYLGERDRNARLRAAQAASAEAFRLARIERREGALPYLDLLSAEQTLIAADAALAASDRQIVDDQIAVFKALGGGWRPAGDGR